MWVGCEYGDCVCVVMPMQSTSSVWGCVLRDCKSRCLDLGFVFCIHRGSVKIWGLFSGIPRGSVEIWFFQYFHRQCGAVGFVLGFLIGSVETWGLFSGISSGRVVGWGFVSGIGWCGVGVWG